MNDYGVIRTTTNIFLIIIGMGSTKSKKTHPKKVLICDNMLGGYLMGSGQIVDYGEFLAR